MWKWRIVLRLCRWMNISIHLPLLHCYLKGGDNISRSHRHASLARIVLFADACTDYDHGLDYYFHCVFHTSSILY